MNDESIKMVETCLEALRLHGPRAKLVVPSRERLDVIGEIPTAHHVREAVEILQEELKDYRKHMEELRNLRIAHQRARHVDYEAKSGASILAWRTLFGPPEVVYWDENAWISSSGVYPPETFAWWAPILTPEVSQ